MKIEIEIEEVKDVEDLEFIYAWCGLFGCGGQIT